MKKAGTGMAQHTTIGAQGEEIAARYLLGKKYEILQRNFRSRHGEIDIIARRKNVLIFVEVKTRRSSAFGSPLEAVSLKKQRSIGSVAQAYLQHNRLNGSAARFDVIAVLLGSGAPEIEHIENAFELPGY
jgi:putative endonuclease